MSKITSSRVQGVHASPVTVDATSGGVPGLEITGLGGEAQTRELRVRVRAALVASGFPPTLSGSHTLTEALAFANGYTPACPIVKHRPLVEDRPLDAIPSYLQAAHEQLCAAVREGRNVLLVGPPGAGKTVLARRAQYGAAPLALSQQREIAQIHSCAGLGAAQGRPFRAPHHTASEAALVGGGTGHVRPGEATLASGGVLFLDELPEFRRTALAALQHALERGAVNVRGVRMPARPVVIAAMNPCPCGRPGDRCNCTQAKIDAYHARVAAFVEQLQMVRIDVPAFRACRVSGE